MAQIENIGLLTNQKQINWIMFMAKDMAEYWSKIIVVRYSHAGEYYQAIDRDGTIYPTELIPVS